MIAIARRRKASSRRIGAIGRRQPVALDQDTALQLLLGRRAMLIGYIKSIVRDPHLAEDVFQNVALLVVRKREAIPSAEAFPGWARRAARFEALAALRKRSRAPKPMGEEVLDVLDEQWSADETPDEERARALRGCLEKLSPKSRELVRARYAEGVDGKALAHRLGKPANTIYVALSRIHRKLAECVRARLGGLANA
jgi:RNA polymerase sigma-70 factor (ECF subfamily)